MRWWDEDETLWLTRQEPTVGLAEQLQIYIYGFNLTFSITEKYLKLKYFL
ncbi:hypothetical protein [Oscillatoria acuminata]|nr:hypothetical protein [Oscillatoria acuminata]